MISSPPRLWLIGLALVLLFPSLAEAGELYFPQVVVGGGYSTTFTLLNTDSFSMTGQLRVFNQDGSQRATPEGWESIFIPAAGSMRFTLDNRDGLTVGSAYFQATANVNGVAAFERRRSDGTLETLASVLGVASGARFLVPVEITSSNNGTGVALVNATTVPVNVRFQLLAENGATIGTNTDARFSPFGERNQTAEFVTNLFPQLSLKDFKGTLIVETAGPFGAIAVTALTVKEGMLSGLPAIGSFVSPSTGILMGILGGGPFSMRFQTAEISLQGSYPFILSPGTYEVSGRLSTTLVIGLGSTSISGLTSKVAANSIRNIEGPLVQVSPCFIAYTALSNSQPFRFQFTVAPDNGETCKGAFSPNSFFTDSSNAFVQASSLTSESIVIAGMSRVGDWALFVRAYDTTTGVLRWADQTPGVSGLVTSIFLTRSEESVYVAGYTPSVACCSDIFVRGYKASTGQVLWTNIYDKGRDDLPQDFAVSSQAAVVVGYGGNTATPPIGALDFLVRAYQPETGLLLWEDRLDSDFLVDDAAWEVTIDGTRVFVAGTSSTHGVGRSLFLRTYDVRSGSLEWATLLDGVLPPSSLSVIDGTLLVRGPGYSLRLSPENGTLIE